MTLYAYRMGLRPNSRMAVELTLNKGITTLSTLITRVGDFIELEEENQLKIDKLGRKTSSPPKKS